MRALAVPVAPPALARPMAPAASAGFRRPPAPRRHNAGMNTLAERLGTRWPLIQAPMAGSQGSALALAV